MLLSRWEIFGSVFSGSAKAGTRAEQSALTDSSSKDRGLLHMTFCVYVGVETREVLLTPDPMSFRTMQVALKGKREPSLWPMDMCSTAHWRTAPSRLLIRLTKCGVGLLLTIVTRKHVLHVEFCSVRRYVPSPSPWRVFVFRAATKALPPAQGSRYAAGLLVYILRTAPCCLDAMTTQNIDSLWLFQDPGILPAVSLFDSSYTRCPKNRTRREEVCRNG